MSESNTRSGIPIVWQTMLLLLASLGVALAVNIAMFVAMPAPRPDFVPLSEIADALGGRDRPHAGGRNRPRREELRAVASAAAPAPSSDDMVSDDGLSRRLARQLDLPVWRVRLFYEADQRGGLGFRSRRSDAGVPIRRGEPYFFNTVVAAAQADDGTWRIVRTPERPWLSAWQRRLILWFGISALVLLPFAFLFARRLTRPIRRFAAAADRLGRDPDAPSVPAEGPRELRTTAHALNAMQHRLHGQLRERTAMIGAIAHDLRTPLARIAFRIEGAPDELRAAVQSDVEQMRAMIAATIGYIRGIPDAGARVEVDVAVLLERIAADAREMGAAFVAHTGPAVASGDPVAIERMFQNLVDNALAYAGGGEATVARRGATVVTTIADRGPGIAPEKIEALFEPFARGDPSRSRATGGLGLGLAIARSIAEAHGGSVTARNREGGGLEVRVELPAA